MDITKRKLAEDAIRDSEERFRAVFDHSPIGIGLARDGNVLSGNDAFLRLFGYTDMAELYGRPLTDLIIPSSARRNRQPNDPAPARQTPAYVL